MRALLLTLFGSLLMLTGCGTASGTIGLTQADDETGIVGGNIFTGLPAVGSLTYGGEEYCTATLIGPRKVLTAAHCLQDVSATDLNFVIGARLSSPEYTLSVSSIKPHPAFDPYDVVNDVGLVTLSSDAPIDSLGVLSKMDSSWVGTKLFFVGYGVTSAATGAGAGTKRSVWMNISQVDSGTFSYDDPGKNTCYGDSGGPAFYESNGVYQVAGVTSYGDQNCASYGVDTRADAYLNFIGETGGSTPTEPNSVTVEDVTFTADEVAKVLDLVNNASQETLDIDVSLDSRAAANIVAKRPLNTIQDLAVVSYVGKSALTKLKNYVDLNG